MEGGSKFVPFHSLVDVSRLLVKSRTAVSFLSDLESEKYDAKKKD